MLSLTVNPRAPDERRESLRLGRVWEMRPTRCWAGWPLTRDRSGRMLRTLPWATSTHTSLTPLGLDVGKEGWKRAGEQSQHTLQRSTEGKPVRPKDGNWFVCGGFKKKRQFLWPETWILSQEWVSDFDLARQILETPNILNISLFCALFILNHPSYYSSFQSLCAHKVLFSLLHLSRSQTSLSLHSSLHRVFL